MFREVLERYFIRGFYAKYILFSVSVGFSLFTNILVVRNLESNEIRYWILANTMAGLIAVILQATQFREYTSFVVNDKNSERDTARNFKPRNVLWFLIAIIMFSILALLPISYELKMTWTYILLMTPLIYRNFLIQSFFQNSSRQLLGLFVTISIVSTFFMFIATLINFGILNLTFMVAGNYLITFLFTLLAIRSIRLRPRLRDLGVSDFKNITFYTLYWLLCMMDIPLVSFFSSSIDQNLYAAASTYGKFSFLITQFFLYFKLPKIKNEINPKNALKTSIAMSSLSQIPVLVLFMLPDEITIALFTNKFADIPNIALSQSFALFPFLVSMLYVQILISKSATPRMLLPIIFSSSCLSAYILIQPNLYSTFFAHFVVGVATTIVLKKMVGVYLNKQIAIEDSSVEYVFVIGTTAEIIKLAPLVDLMPRPQIWNLSQQNFQVESFIAKISSKGGPKITTLHGKGLQSGYKSIFWLMKSFGFLRGQVLQFKRENRMKNYTLVILIHGDTLTAGLTAVVAKLFGLRVVHIEAGLRSNNIWHPFPEEIIRLIITRFADLHFCPTEKDMLNIKRSGVQKVVTNGNTFLNTFVPIVQEIIAEDNNRESSFKQKAPFILVHLHRLEFMRKKRLVKETFVEIIQLHKDFELVLVLDPHLEMVLSELQLLSDVHKNMNVIGKQTRKDFVRLLLQAEFVITDSGGTQEELGIIGVPALIHRIATERTDGINLNVILSEWKQHSIENFSKNYKDYRGEFKLTESDPVQTIFATLKSEFEK